MAADVKLMPGAQAIYGLIRNTETSEIRILLYKQPPNCAHTMTCDWMQIAVIISRRRRGDYKPIYTADAGRLFINANN